MVTVTGEAPLAGRLRHEALFYRDDCEFLRGTVPFVREAGELAEPVLVAVPGPRLDLLREVLGEDPGDVRFVDIAQVGRNPNRIIPWVLRAFVDEFADRPVRIIGEPIWPGRAPEEVPLAVQHEALINVALADATAVVLCPYDAAQLHAGVLMYAGRTHPVLVDGADRRAQPGYADPYEIVALLNQALPEPTVPVTELTFDGTGLARLRQAVATVARDCGLSADRVVDLQIAVNEIATNAVVHGGGYGRYRGWQGRDRLICEIRSDGELTDWLAGRVRPAPYTERGRGLLLANRLCDLVETYTEPTSTTTRLHMCH